MIAIFTREPFNLSIQQFSRLNDYQLFHCLLRPRDEDGMLIRPAGAQADQPGRLRKIDEVSFKEMYRQVWAARGASAEEIAGRWKKYLVKNPGLE